MRAVVFSTTPRVSEESQLWVFFYNKDVLVGMIKLFNQKLRSVKKNNVAWDVAVDYFGNHEGPGYFTIID